ncbi:MAG: adaptor protein MecA [Lachnospiraceae bacterium]|nr:adaptor protein MecA [Lachnospiraceae bacterium]
MEYIKQEELKVTCIAEAEDFVFFGITMDDLLDRTEGARRFLQKVKELAGQSQGVEWTNVAYTLQISVLSNNRVSLTFSETIADYIASLKHSAVLADKDTIGPLEEFIRSLEKESEEKARQLVARFEKNVRETK